MRVQEMLRCRWAPRAKYEKRGRLPEPPPFRGVLRLLGDRATVRRVAVTGEAVERTGVATRGAEGLRGDLRCGVAGVVVDSCVEIEIGHDELLCSRCAGGAFPLTDFYVASSVSPLAHLSITHQSHIIRSLFVQLERLKPIKIFT